MRWNTIGKLPTEECHDAITELPRKYEGTEGVFGYFGNIFYPKAKTIFTK